VYGRKSVKLLINALPAAEFFICIEPVRVRDDHDEQYELFMKPKWSYSAGR